MNHVRQQPLYKTLKQYRVLAICSVIFIGWLMVDLLDWYKTAAESLSAEASAGLFAFLAALLGAFIKALNHVREKQEE